ncbi:MAG TPA: FecR domain-containing protein [Pusillimonas sp.]|uniref:FecR family protein n=1 Tax=unclassified Pusillimonas TaxID=2640016 RepID=UPI00261F01FF|nr:MULTISPECIES: FecR domain-containing protein [unclassified Pusillimonas]HLU20671.1 FecR domain-containing protein [Pusillimonas sp.]
MPFSRFAGLISLVFALAFGPSATAQPAGAKGDDFLYRVRSGDTLIGLAQRYTLHDSNWKALQELNGVDDPYRLQIARLLRIPFSMIPVRAATAEVTHVAGEVTIDGRELPFAAQVSEGQKIQTGANGYVVLQLSDQSVVTVPPSTTLVIKRIREFQGTGLTDSIFEMETGSVETQVAPQETGVGRFEVRTPVSVTGVRGTRMRVHADGGSRSSGSRSSGSRSEVVSGMAGVAGAGAGELILRERQGVAMDRDGKSLGVRPLLPAPKLLQPVRAAGGWSMEFEPVAGASAYLVSVARDESGAQLVSQQRIQAPPAHFSASAAGTHYVFVRAIDDAGIGGVDASASFEGAYVLMDGSGNAVSTLGGGMVLVADY